jgi:N-acetylated-alpha-linked acidic dipeptidase
MLERFKSCAERRTANFFVVYPTPKCMTLKVVATNSFNATPREEPITGDATSPKTSGALPPYNIFGADGAVIGELVDRGTAL